MLETGVLITIEEIATAEKINASYVGRGCCQSNANSSPEVARFVNVMRVYAASIRHSAWAAERPCL